MKKILYLHGMGGGMTSRIPAILKEDLAGVAQVTVNTYDFDPEKGRAQVEKWFEQIKPDLVIGESLGSLQALMIQGVSHIFVSPALGAPQYFKKAAPFARLTLVRKFFNHKYRPTHEGRQELDFSYENLNKYYEFSKEAFSHTPLNGSKDSFYAFFGTRDHYMKMGVVDINLWKIMMEPQGVMSDSTYTMYEGTHFMENEFVHTLLVDKIKRTLDLQ